MSNGEQALRQKLRNPHEEPNRTSLRTDAYHDKKIRQNQASDVIFLVIVPSLNYQR